jgi:hypothetical protein
VIDMPHTPTEDGPYPYIVLFSGCCGRPNKKMWRVMAATSEGEVS